MLLNDFNYTLPEDLIAQIPTAQRDASRLMCLDRNLGSIETGSFSDILNYFRPGDVLVLNDTRVIPARLIGRKQTGGRVEVFLVRSYKQAESHEDWLCLTKTSRSLKYGTVVSFSPEFKAEILEPVDESYRRVRFFCPGDFMAAVERYGHLPLPPYIKRKDTSDDRSRYQTVFARENGAVAAPTAGLHFTEKILQQLQAKGVEILNLTLHVGLGTFIPVRVEDIRQHRMHSEFYRISEKTANSVNCARAAGHRVFALGTTSARAMETSSTDSGELMAGSGESDIFIYPGYTFKVVDALVTNFHLPKSTLLMLVSAFAGRDFILSAYHRAIAERFRFFSYGDCMLIV
ncbi:MAG: tRNA preQ1(34) S-adenosylmethionine ribosyltransferase-isomerase QueA [Desulfuromonadales bacterium]|nr:tRNA preQ1(34) S-adenosylmethionine ribosyltransferase-isomerase QueA [Desulfuromonadales bacterium]MBN2791253.1 tRNA preQ1(34) S-adenosylmethionine ribosyltransferase-isomerase QueA [Desulfuromonadales bacterium]